MSFNLLEYKYRPAIAALETATINVLINRYDAWVANNDWAKVTPKDWYNNLHAGFQTDGNAFGVNFFSHPYHGSLFFNAARQNGKDFWGSIPYVLVGSWTWEYFGETYPPSEIDWNTTSIGGVYLGEITHRLSLHLLHDHKNRDLRFIRGLSATVLNPIGRINDWLYTDIKKISHSPSRRQFPVVSQFSIGYSRLFKSNTLFPNRSYPTINYSLIYGDLFKDKDGYKPFDFFIFRAWWDINTYSSFEQNYFNVKSHAPIMKFNKSNHSLFTLSGHYDFIHNNVFKIGSMAITVDYQLKLQTKQLTLMLGVKLGPILFGSSRSEIMEVLDLTDPNGEDYLRDYIYGRGYTLESESLLLTKNMGRVILNYNFWVIYAVRDTPGTERNSILELEYYYPIWNNWSIGLKLFQYNRFAHYNDFVDFQNIRNGYSEIKILCAITF